MKKLLLAPACLALLAYALMATTTDLPTSKASDPVSLVDGVDETNAEGATLGSTADVVCAELSGAAAWGTDGVVRAYSFGTTSCNIGNDNLLWQQNGTNHPVISQHLYRIDGNGRLEHIGMGWLKHAFCALQIASTCAPGCSQQGGCLAVLTPGCQDPYTPTRNGDQAMLGPRFQVNAFTGQYRWGYFQQGMTGNFAFKRIPVRLDDLNPVMNPGATYLAECGYTAFDDATDGQHYNNSSSRNMVVTGSAPNFNLINSGATHRTQPAIFRWPIVVPDAQVVTVDAAGERDSAGNPSPLPGRFYVGNLVRDNGNGTWTYTYAVYNLNSHRSADSFSVPVPAGVHVSNINFHAADYHSGEPWSNADWAGVRYWDSLTWNIGLPYNPALNDPTNFPPVPVDLTGNTGNALRWGTTHTYAFTADLPPQDASATVGLYRPGTPGSPDSVPAQVRAPSAPVGLDGDMNCDGVVTVADIAGFALALTSPSAFDVSFPACLVINADINDDGFVTVSDISQFVLLLSGG